MGHAASEKAPQVFTVSQVRLQQLSGFSNLPEAEQKLWRERAESYKNYRLSKSGGNFWKSCDKDFQPFCRLEEFRLEEKLAKRRAQVRDRAQRVHGHEVLRLVQREDWGRLSRLDPRTAQRAMAGLRKKDDLRKVSTAVQGRKGCDLAPVHMGLAVRMEEEFPDTEWVGRATDHYHAAALCLNTSEGLYARFRAGLLQLWRKGCDQLVDWFEPISKAERVDESLRVRALYWGQHCAEASGKRDIAKNLKVELKRRVPLSFHNLLVNRESPMREAPEGGVRLQFRSERAPQLNDLLVAVEALQHVDAPKNLIGDLLAPWITTLAEAEPELQLYAAVLLDRSQQTLPKFRLLSQLLLSVPETVQTDVLQMYFPLWYFDVVKDKAAGIDPFLVMALIRQESAFQPNAQSAVGARGLMQVMPATARSLGVRDRRKLFQPEIGIQAGVKFMRQRLGEFNGDVELTLASYNAGPARVREWIGRYPVDRRMLFLDLIPYRETRDYVTLIMRNYLWYAKLYSGRKLYLEADRKLAQADSTMALKFMSLSQEETVSSR